MTHSCPPLRAAGGGPSVRSARRLGACAMLHWMLLGQIAPVAADEHPRGSIHGRSTANHQDPFCRAGNPDGISPLAVTSRTSGYTGYYVGGSRPFRGAPRYCHEGTWGWDSTGKFFRRRVALPGWHQKFSPHAARRQGSYQTDGPKLLHAHE